MDMAIQPQSEEDCPQPPVSPPSDHEPTLPSAPETAGPYFGLAELAVQQEPFQPSPEAEPPGTGDVQDSATDPLQTDGARTDESSEAPPVLEPEDEPKAAILPALSREAPYFDPTEIAGQEPSQSSPDNELDAAIAECAGWNTVKDWFDEW